MLKVPLLVSSIAVALVFSAGSVAAVKTHDAESRLDFFVAIFDKRMEMRLTTSQLPCRGVIETMCYPQEWTRVRVGQVVGFTIVNKGKVPHNFKIFGKVRTKAIMPGGKATFSVQLEKRGRFPFLSTLNGHNGLRGIFYVMPASVVSARR